MALPEADPPARPRLSDRVSFPRISRSQSRLVPEGAARENRAQESPSWGQSPAQSPAPWPTPRKRCRRRHLAGPLQEKPRARAGSALGSRLPGPSARRPCRGPHVRPPRLAQPALRPPTLRSPGAGPSAPLDAPTWRPRSDAARTSAPELPQLPARPSGQPLRVPHPGTRLSPPTQPPGGRGHAGSPGPPSHTVGLARSRCSVNKHPFVSDPVFLNMC